MKRRIAALLLALLGITWLWMCPPVLAAPATGELQLTQEEERALENAARAALESCVGEDMTDVEKLTAAHDKLCLTCDYGLSPRRETAYGALVEGVAVCRGYAAGYAYLADLLGLDGTWTYSEEIDHAWVLATLGGQRYFTDATWDDGKDAKLGLIRHEYFLFDETNAAETEHSGWDSTEDVPGGALEDVPWVRAVTRVIFDGGFCWYFDGDMTLWRCDRDTWQTEALFSKATRWPVADKPGYVYGEVFTGLVLIGDRLWFNTPYEICSVAMDGTDERVEFTPDTSAGEIYGIGVQDEKLCYSIAASPDDVLYNLVNTPIDASSAWGY